MQLFLNILVFNVRLLKGQMWKMKAETKSASPLNFLELIWARAGRSSPQRREVQQQWLLGSLSAPLDKKQQSAVRTQIPNIWATESSWPTVVPRNVCKLLLKHVHSSLPCSCMGRTGSCYPPKGWNWLKLTTVCPGLCLKQKPEFQKLHQSDSSCALV